MMKDTMMRLDAVFGSSGVQLYDSHFPIGEEINDHYHWHMEINPKLQSGRDLSGGTGFYINPDAAGRVGGFLREARIGAAAKK